jgi:PAS domain S-box-containing protein
VKPKHKPLIQNIKHKRAENTLTRHETLYRNLVENSADIIYLADTKGRITFMNRGGLNAFETTEAEMIDQEFYPNIHPEDLSDVITAYREMLRTGDPVVNYECRFVKKRGRGEVFPVSQNISVIKNERGDIIGTQGIARDITERKRAEEVLRESDARLRHLVAYSPSVIYSIRPRGNTPVSSFISENLEDILGYKPEEICDFKFWQSIIHPEDLPSLMVHIKAILKRKTAITLEYRCKHKDGAYRWLRDTNTPIFDKDGQLLELVGSWIDITERKRAEEALRENEENLRITLNSIGEGVIAVDTKGRLTHMNPIAEKLTSWKFEEAKGKPLLDVFNTMNEDIRQVFSNPISTILTEGLTAGPGIFANLISKDGTKYDITNSAAPIKDANGNITGMVLVFRDVTEQLRTEAELFKSKKLESVGVLAGGIAHDFNNILTGLFGNLQLAMVTLPREHESYTYIETASQALQRTALLTEQLLTFAKGGDPILETLDLRQIVHNTVTFNLSGSNVKAHINLPDDLWQVKADKGQISQVIANLAINSKQAMPNGGSLYIDAENIKDLKERADRRSSSEFVKLSLRDEGLGISAKYIERIFDPYFSTKQSGSGLGLSIVHSIITKHRGHISVDSTPDVGTTFTILLPAERYSHKPATATHLDMIETATSSSGHILVMDDEELVRDVSKNMLETFGFTVELAFDGREAVEKYISADESGNPFDIVIMDLTIPGGMGGKEAVNNLLAINSNAKVIVSSGYSTDPILANYGDYGFKGRLVKPFQIKDLKKELTRVMEVA